MFIIYFTKEWHLPPFYKRVTSSSKSDCLLQSKSSRLYFIIPLSRRRGKAQVLVTPPLSVKKLGAVMAATADPVLAPDSQLALSFCLGHKSQSPNGHGWHCDIFRHSKRPDLSGNQFCFTNLGLFFGDFPCFFISLHGIFMIIKILFKMYVMTSSVIKPCSYFNLHC